MLLLILIYHMAIKILLLNLSYDNNNTAFKSITYPQKYFYQMKILHHDTNSILKIKHFNPQQIFDKSTVLSMKQLSCMHLFSNKS